MGVLLAAAWLLWSGFFKPLLLALGGPVTVMPLLLFAIAARRLPLTTIGFMQFLAPSLQFATGVYYGEQLTLPRLVCFGCIWAAVAIFSIDAFYQQKRRPPRISAGP